MLKGTIDLLILSLFAEKDNYGYEISRAIKERTEGTFEIQEPTLYIALKRLEKQNAISSYWGTETQGGRRKYYKITDTGLDLLQQTISQWKQMSEMINRFI